jgi:negative regulator of sigma E activity
MTSERDAKLSALLDGALAPGEESALRAELARDPALAARLAQLARVDAALRALPVRQVPADLRARLHAKLAAEASAGPALSAVRAGAPARPTRRRAWLAGLSAAAAAAAAALVVVVIGPGRERDGVVSPASELAASRMPDAPAREVTSDSTADALAQAPGAAAGLAASARPDSVELPGAVDASVRHVTAATSAAATHPGSSLAIDSAPAESRRGAQDGGLAPADSSSPGGSSATRVATAADSREHTADLASSTSAGAAAQPALWIEATDDEAAALGELEPADAGVVAVLDWLGELDALEAEAS